MKTEFFGNKTNEKLKLFIFFFNNKEGMDRKLVNI